MSKREAKETVVERAVDAYEKGSKQQSESLLDGGRNNKFFFYVRVGIFCILVLLEIFIFALNLEGTTPYLNIPKWILVLCLETVFTISSILKTFVVKEFKYKIACYVVDFLAQFALTFLVSGGYLCYIYLLMLSEFYMSTTRLGDCIGMGVASLVVYVLTYAFAEIGSLDVLKTVAVCIGEIFIIVLHFCIMNFALYAYDSQQKLKRSLQELDESNQKLQAAYDELAEVTVLQERQRIAKDIHDTAGHSITTVIMQTEAAKLIVEENPQEAKRKIVAANLQAKNALEELRESVHLLAGDRAAGTLKDDLERVVHDSCDGTDIVIRASIEDVTCSPAKRRFLTNTLKEGISNGLRHGHATAFYFELKEEDGEIAFLLSDNGLGADMGTLKSGFGLKSMHRRVESLGGTLKFTTAVDDGFEIAITLPADDKTK